MTLKIRPIELGINQNIEVELNDFKFNYHYISEMEIENRKRWFQLDKSISNEGNYFLNLGSKIVNRNYEARPKEIYDIFLESHYDTANSDFYADVLEKTLMKIYLKRTDRK